MGKLTQILLRQLFFHADMNELFLFILEINSTEQSFTLIGISDLASFCQSYKS
tara:strand:+ start:1901 stop:2059 length:159 start_codon:yes stop_codon:yes gene_type:complete